MSYLNRLARIGSCVHILSTWLLNCFDLTIDTYADPPNNARTFIYFGA